jgi:hypothetical protein
VVGDQQHSPAGLVRAQQHLAQRLDLDRAGRELERRGALQRIVDRVDHGGDQRALRIGDRVEHLGRRLPPVGLDLVLEEQLELAARAGEVLHRRIVAPARRVGTGRRQLARCRHAPGEEGRPADRRDRRQGREHRQHGAALATARPPAQRLPAGLAQALAELAAARPGHPVDQQD